MSVRLKEFGYPVKKMMWIDCAKAAAILAVLVDHTAGTLYQSGVIRRASFYSVSLFILLMGITTYISECKSEMCGNQNKWERVKRRISKIFWPYFGATFIYSLAIDHMFDLNNFIIRLLLFNVSGPFYYVFLYIQLIFANVVLYEIIQKCDERQYSWGCKIFIGIGITMISFLTTRYSNMLNIYGGGGKLFGGTYLLLTYVGMLAAPYLINRWDKKHLINLAVGTSVLLGVIFCYNIFSDDFFRFDDMLPFGDDGINPPGITLMGYAVVILFWCFSVGSICEGGNSFIKKIVTFVKMIGENSLYIFLYHRLILDYFLIPYVIIENMWIRRVCYLLCMIGIPILGKRIYMAIGKGLAYQVKGEGNNK